MEPQQIQQQQQFDTTKLVDIPKTLNKEQFNTKITFAAILVQNKDVEKVRHELREYIYVRKLFKTIISYITDTQDQQQPQQNSHKLILLKPEFSSGASSLEERDKRWPQALIALIKQLNCQIVPHQVTLTFDDLTYNEILEKIIPPEVGIPTGFEVVGKLAHFNLRPSQYPYKFLIGETLLAKNRNIVTVVNKLQKLHNVYRTPELEYLAGKQTCETQLNEGKCVFHLDFQKVYWSSRNSMDRDRILNFMKKGETLLDLFCGIGPLSVRAGKMGLYVIANDLNPACYKYLQKNVEVNKIQDMVMCYNQDAKDMVRRVLVNEKIKKIVSDIQQKQNSNKNWKKKQQQQQKKKSANQKNQQEEDINIDQQQNQENKLEVVDNNKNEQQQQQQSNIEVEEEKAPISKEVFEAEFGKNFQHFDHVYMNLPVLAIDFLFIFRGLLKQGNPEIWNENNLPLIHVFGFVKAETDEQCQQLLIQRIQAQLPHFTKESVVSFAHVKNVTIKKREYCISFRLNKQDALLDVMTDNPELTKKINEMSDDEEEEFLNEQNNDNKSENNDTFGDEIKKKVKSNEQQLQ